MDVPITSVKDGACSRLLALPPELLDHIILLCAEVEKPHEAVFRTHYDSEDGEYFAQSETDEGDYMLSSEREPGERHRHFHLRKKINKLGPLRLVCHLLSYYVSIHFWAKLSNVTTPALNDTSVRQMIAMHDKWPYVREIEINVQPRGILFEIPPGSVMKWAVVLWTCRNIQKLHLCDTMNGGVLSNLPKEWNELVPGVKEITYNCTVAPVTRVPLRNLMTLWTAPNLNAFRIGGVEIVANSNDNTDKERRSCRLAPVKYVSFRGCALEPQVPAALMGVHDAVNAEIREVDREITLQIGRYPVGQQSFFQDVMDRHSHPLPNMAGFARLQRLKIDLGNMCYLYWNEHPTRSLTDHLKRGCLTPAWDKSRRLDPLNTGGSDMLPETITDLTIEIRTYRVDYAEASRLIRKWLVRLQTAGGQSIFPSGLQKLSLVALQCCRKWKKCNRGWDAWPDGPNWHWGVNIVRVPRLEMKDQAPEDHVAVFDSTRGSFLFEQLKRRDTAAMIGLIAIEKEDRCYGRDEDPVDSDDSAGESNCTNSTGSNMSDNGNDSDANGVSEQDDDNDSESSDDTVLKELFEADSETYWREKWTRHIIAEADSAGVSLVLINSTRAMSEGAIVGYPGECQLKHGSYTYE